MLPFLQSNKIVSIISGRKHDKDAKEPANLLEQASKALLSAIEAKDSLALAEAMRNMFQELDLEPHEEGSHLSDKE